MITRISTRDAREGILTTGYPGYDTSVGWFNCDDEQNAVHVTGVSEFLAVSLMCKKSGIPVVPHVGDMGQLHRCLVLFNHIGLDLPVVNLEHIPHLRQHFVHPVGVERGVYRALQEAGAACDLKP